MAHDRGIILDIDGTLIDSNDAHARAWEEAGEALGYDLPFDRVRPLIGMGADRVMALLLGLAEDSPEGRELTDTCGRIFRRRHLRDIQPLPRVRELLQRLRDDGFTLAVATSASGEQLDGLLDRAGVSDLIQHATSSSDAEDSKPAPDIVEAAIARSNCDRDRLLMIGDTPYDVEAARRARIPIVGVRSGGWDDDELEGAVGVYDHTGELFDRYERVFL
jgi:HAD superfamily hydrolase (TIGR01509 family)